MKTLLELLALVESTKLWNLNMGPMGNMDIAELRDKDLPTVLDQLKLGDADYDQMIAKAAKKLYKGELEGELSVEVVNAQESGDVIKLTVKLTDNALDGDMAPRTINIKLTPPMQAIKESQVKQVNGKSAREPGGYSIDGEEFISDEAEALVDHAKEVAYNTGKRWQDVLLTMHKKK
jgi:hypothetical protein